MNHLRKDYRKASCEFKDRCYHVVGTHETWSAALAKSIFIWKSSGESKTILRLLRQRCVASNDNARSDGNRMYSRFGTKS